LLYFGLVFSLLRDKKVVVVVFVRFSCAAVNAIQITRAVHSTALSDNGRFQPLIARRK
jgi:hypothetical protein